MKTPFLLAALLTLPASAETLPLPVVPSVDLARYMETWYEIARTVVTGALPPARPDLVSGL